MTKRMVWAAVAAVAAAQGAFAAGEPSEGVPGTSIEDRFTALEGKFDAMNEPFLEALSTVNSLKRIKLTGYIQARYEYHWDSKDATAAAPTTNTDSFYIRRGRLKATYDGDWMEYVLQIDAIGSGVGGGISGQVPGSGGAVGGVQLKNAEATYKPEFVGLPMGPLSLAFTVGQFDVPFGHEIMYSSSKREMPERSMAESALFSGERDRGARLMARWWIVRAMGGVLNGNGISSSTEPDLINGRDRKRRKDFSGRIGVDLGRLPGGISVSGGISRYAGFWRVIPATTATPTPQQWFGKSRKGADVQLYLDMPYIGGMQIRGEVYEGETALGSGGKGVNTRSQGGYVIVSQNILTYGAVFYRFDRYDPNTDQAASSVNISRDATRTHGGGVQIFLTPNLRFSATMEDPHLMDPVVDETAPGWAAAHEVNKRFWVFQMQAMF